MTDYVVDYTLLDGKTISFTAHNREESIIEYTNALTSTFSSFISPDGSRATIINNQNVLYMEVKAV